MPSRRELANAIRALAMDAVQKAKSGHPGMPMGMADIAEVLWNDFLVHNPLNPNWLNRDRFILSNGHGSMLQYALLHLTGYDLTIDDLKAFRQLHSRTPGHPEYDETPGVETTTGPLGQGLGNGVGMALAEKILAAEFNRPEFPIIDHYTYVFTGDGCLMEGISHEVCSLAGTLGLGKLIVIYDDNGISIDGKTASWFNENVPERFKAYHWHVISDIDGHNPEAVKKAIEEAQKVTDKPSLLCCKTVIGYGAPNAAGSEETHGAPLGEKEIEAARLHLNWPYKAFEIPEAIYTAWNAKEKGKKQETEWDNLFKAYQKKYPELAENLQRRANGKLPENWSSAVEHYLQTLNEKKPDAATRKASQMALEAFAPVLPELFGGSADLTGSNNTNWSGTHVITHDNFDGNYLHYGVREFGMSAMMNGMALHGGFIPYGGTFLVFLDYARNAVRLCSLMKQRVIFVYSHDSIGLGEDGPTHQPVEHITMLRTTPGIHVWRPADALETAAAWQMAIERSNGPSALLLSRQNLPYLVERQAQAEEIRRGGYVLYESHPHQDPEILLVATGSEVHLAVKAAHQLEGCRVRVVSMPCCEVFQSQDTAYQHSVLPPHIQKRIVIEAGSTAYWYQYAGLYGKIIGIDRFGLSAPGQDIFNDLGISVNTIVQSALELIHHQHQEKKACLSQ